MDAATPLYVKNIIQDGEQYLHMWLGDGKEIKVKSPLIPYLYSHKLIENSLIINSIKDSYKLMSDNKIHEMYKYEFKNLKNLEEFKSLYFEDCIDTISERYIDAIVQHMPEFFKSYPSKNIKVLVYDIEQATDFSRFPTKDDAIISIAWAINDSEEQQQFSDGHDDTKLISDFARLLINEKPDILVGFNSNKYDNVRLMEKFDMLGIPNHIWGRENRNNFTYSKKIGPNEMVCMNNTGVLFFDVYHSALVDQTLNGKKRGLKAVSKHYAKDLGIDKIIEVDVKNTIELMGTEKLREYNICDVTNTRILFNFYVQNILSMSSFSGAPLNRLTPLATTYGFTQVLGNIFVNEKIIPDSNNKKRYPWAWEEMFTWSENHEELEQTKVFQGATSNCYKFNYLAFDLVEEDVNSLYPAIMGGIGIGPDNTRLIGKEAFGPFRVIKIGDKRTFFIPDEVRKWNWIVEVVGTSKVAETINNYMAERLKIKKLSKNATGHDNALYAIAYSMKINLNSAFGLSASEEMPYGELGVGILTTYAGRAVIAEGRDFVGVDKVIYVDTDSLKYERLGGKTTKELNDHFKVWFAKTFYSPNANITWDDKKIPAGFFKQDKSYVLLTTTGELEKVGGAFKGSKYTDIFNKVIDDIGLILLTKGVDEARKACRKWIDIENYPKENFIMEVKLGMNINEYASKSATAPAMALKAQEQLGIEPYVGQIIPYVKTNYGYDLPTDKAMNDLDNTYYLQTAIDAFERFNLLDIVSEKEFKYLTKPKSQTRLEFLWG